MHVRNGYMIEHDLQTASANGCQPLRPRDPATAPDLLGSFAEAFVRLGEKYNVSPVVVLSNPRAPYLAMRTRSFAMDLARLRTAYPSLKIPYDPIETWPENFFSVPAHVQRTIAIETSRRLGRALSALESGRDMAENLAAKGPILSNPKMHVIGATLIEECGWNPDYKAGYYADVSEVFREACDGKTECAYQKGSDTRDQLPPRSFMQASLSHRLSVPRRASTISSRGGTGKLQRPLPHQLPSLFVSRPRPFALRHPSRLRDLWRGCWRYRQCHNADCCLMPGPYEL